MIERNLGPVLLESARYYPVVTLTGPRQSGKTTLCRALFPDKPYVSLEALDVREYARSDPRAFLAEQAGGAVLDEVQHVPELTSWIQVAVDEDPRPGRFVLTGSQRFGLSEAIAQSLAGRTAVHHLLPPSLDELRRFERAPTTLLETLFTGAYPRIHDRGIPAERWLSDYVTTYVQRDVRQVLNVADLSAFTTFLRLAAGRTARELNLSALGADAGVSHNTARSWLSVLETSWLCHRLPPLVRNLRKQLVKAPKLHFLDSGLACHLLGVREPEQLRHHPLRGAVFESWVVSEILKSRVHRGLGAGLLHFRQTRGLEADAVVEGARSLWLVEAKSAETIAPALVEPLRELSALLAPGEARRLEAVLVHAGDRREARTGVTLLPWSAMHDLSWD